MGRVTDSERFWPRGMNPYRMALGNLALWLETNTKISADDGQGHIQQQLGL